MEKLEVVDPLSRTERGSEQFLREYFTLKRAGARKILADAREKQEGMQGQWQQEPPFKEVLEQIKKGRIQTAVPKRCVVLTSQ